MFQTSPTARFKKNFSLVEFLHDRIGLSVRLSFIFFFCGFVWPSSEVIGQDRCSITRYETLLNKKYPNRETPDSFEKWMSGQLNQRPLRTAEEASEVYTIPVVVHIIHNGEPVGTGTNLSEAQILSQITVLNNDFRRLNEDAVKTPSDFLGVAGSLSVEFVLARRDPEGLASSGIVRTNGGRTAWDIDEEGIFKSLSFWPSEDYLNIWVVNLSGNDIGYASFPVSSLAGMEGAVDNRLIDGVIIDYKVFGSKDFGSFDLDPRYNVGRTVTHEVGHYLGLRHIWGDVNSCSGTDFVEDTPPQNGATFDCPSTHPIISCNNTGKMYQNFMDYTQDACMNLFTRKQVDRMIVVMENSPRRKTLTSSLGSIAPVYGLECALSINTPQSSACPGEITPQVIIRNLGDQLVQTVKILPTRNGVPQNAITFSVNLTKGASTLLDFPGIIISSGETATLQFELLEVNGTADELASNNIRQVIATGASAVGLPLEENFTAIPSGWTIQNPDGLTTWGFTSSGGGSVSIDAFNYEQSGELDALFSPVFDATNASALLLQFNVAYARYPGNNNEALYVYVIDDCSENYTNGELIYQKQGSNLATAPDTFSDFVPGLSQWRTETLALTSFIGKSNLRLAFVFRNGFGNNLYLDDLRLQNGPVTDLRIVEVVEPSPAVCVGSISAKILLANLGSTTIEKISGVVQKINGAQQDIPETTVNLAPGSTTILNLPEISLKERLNTLSIEILPVGSSDIEPDNNRFTAYITQITEIDRVPSRENFDQPGGWGSVLTSGALPWGTVNTNKGTSISYQSYSNEVIGETAWLVSPIIDMSKIIESSLFADFSYGTPEGSSEQIKLVASTNCGISFDEVFYEGSADELSTVPSAGNFIPSTEDDWSRNFFDVSALAGQSKVLFGFIITNNNGSNLFIDNIEFFADNDPEPTRIDQLFSVYRDGDTKEEKITFNLPERSTVHFQLYATTGHVVLDNVLPDVLNQTYTLDLRLPSGLYVYRFEIAGRYYAVRHFVP